jgi:hypothetical protein
MNGAPIVVVELGMKNYGWATRPTSSLGPTTTTTYALMVASATSRPSAAPRVEQPLDHLQPPA